MNAVPPPPAPTSPNRILSCAAMLCAVALILYYLVPVTVSAIGFSPHVLAIAAGFMILLVRRPNGIRWHEYAMPFTFLGITLISVLIVPGVLPTTDMLRAWLISLATFWLFCNTFYLLPQGGLDTGAQVLLALWSLAAIAQVVFGEGAYVSSWFGNPPNVVYATGLSNFSNHGAILMMPLLVWTLVFNLDRPGWRRSLLWLSGCAALYFTLSRAGWLALLIAMLVLALRIRKQSGQMRVLLLHAAFALLAALIAWASPTLVDLFEPGGGYSAGRWEISNYSHSPGGLGTHNFGGSPGGVGTHNSVGDYSSASRLVTLQVAVKAVAEYPLTGLGLGQFPAYYEKHYAAYRTANDPVDPRAQLTPHNGYAQFVAEAGIPAFSALLVWLGSILLRVTRRVEPAALAIHASIAGMAGWLLFHDGLYDRQLWILLGCAAALGHGRQFSQDRTP